MDRRRHGDRNRKRLPTLTVKAPSDLPPVAALRPDGAEPHTRVNKARPLAGTASAITLTTQWAAATSAMCPRRIHIHPRSASLPEPGVQSLGRTAARLRGDAVASIEEIGQFLDHSSLTVTSDYLRRLMGEGGARWVAVAARIGA